MADPRSALLREYLRVLDEFRPRWGVWENVPGALSSNNGKDFGALLGEVERLGYSGAWRVLDAQYFGVPQRRKRVFLVLHSSGDWRRPAAVLFEREGLLRDTPARKRAEKTTPGSLVAGIGKRVADCLTANYGKQLDSSNRNAGPVNLVVDYSPEIARCLLAGKGGFRSDFESDTLHSSAGKPRRLTPIECERLQGFPDNWTRVPYRGKPAEECPDGPRYRALGNAMAVPVMRWVGERIQGVENLLQAIAQHD